MCNNEELTDFVEEKLRELYEIPYNDPICVQVHGSYLDVYMPYVSPDTLHISVNGLMRQLDGISKVMSYLRSKTRFVKNILKNSITCKNLSTPLFNAELRFFERNKRTLLDELAVKQSRLNSMYGFVNNVTSKYALNTGTLDLAIELSKISKVFNEVKSGEAIKNALKGEYSKNMVCSLERGVFSVSFYSYTVFEHDLSDYSFECPFNFDAQLIINYKNFKNFFENKLSVRTKKILSEVSRLNSVWTKYKNCFNLSEDVYGLPIDSLRCTTDGYSEFYVNGMPIESNEAEEFYNSCIENLKSKLAAFNQWAVNELLCIEESDNKIVLHKIQNSNSIKKSDLLLDADLPKDAEKIVGELIERGYISEDSNQGTISISKKGSPQITYLQNYRSNGKAYIQNCIDAQKVKELTALSEETNAAESFSELLNASKKEIGCQFKALNKMSVFEVLAFIESEEISYTESQIKELLDLIDQPMFSAALKEPLLSFFEKYDGGKSLPLAQLKYVLL